jgi:hypothetical protein
MKWSNFVATTEYTYGKHAGLSRSFMVRAVSCKHALDKVTAQYPEATTHEVEKCRCSEINNDICSACYRLGVNSKSLDIAD